MYSNTGYLNHSDIEIEDNIHPLIIGSCGIYRMLTVPALRTTRPQGRRDYQLLYVFGGTAVFQKCGRSFTAPAGTFIVYTPGEPQDYEYSASRKTEVCWVHFSGKEVPDLLRQAGFDREGILDGGILPEYHQFFLQMIQELQFGRPCYEELLVHSQFPAGNGDAADAVYHLRPPQPGADAAGKHRLSDPGDRRDGGLRQSPVFQPDFQETDGRAAVPLPETLKFNTL